MCSFILEATTFSIIFDITGKLLTGLKFLRISGSSVDFFNNGPTSACFNGDGNSPLSKDKLTSEVIVLSIDSVHALKREVGKGSKSQDEFFKEDVISFISFSEAGLNLLSETSDLCSTGESEGISVQLFPSTSFSLMSSIFVTKYLLKQVVSVSKLSCDGSLAGCFMCSKLSKMPNSRF